MDLEFSDCVPLVLFVNARFLFSFCLYMIINRLCQGAKKLHHRKAVFNCTTSTSLLQQLASREKIQLGKLGLAANMELLFSQLQCTTLLLATVLASQLASQLELQYGCTHRGLYVQTSPVQSTWKARRLQLATSTVPQLASRVCYRPQQYIFDTLEKTAVRHLFKKGFVRKQLPNFHHMGQTPE